MSHPQAVSRTEKLQAARQFIRDAPLPAMAFALAARDLSWTQARDFVFGLAAQNYFQLDDSVLDQFTAARDADGKVVVTPPAEPPAGSGSSAAHTGMFSIRPDIISGLQVLYISKFTAASDIAGTVRRGVLRNLDPRFLVLLAWLCEMLRTRWGATTLYDLGFGGDENHSGNNAHHWGRAFDLAGVGGEVGWGRYDITVLKHWGKQPVTMPADFGPINPATREHRYKKGQRYPQWPDGFEQTDYRIALPDDPDAFMKRTLEMPAQVDYASRVFADIYQTAAIEGKDTASPQARPTSIGKESRFIIHPDHPNTGLRTHHRDHFHIQVGPTEHAGFWRS
ncbi:hypothetical protein [Aquisphaera insulae]|uniref:hypothetical protein n=1 Tax=Aquisphaera insulae TaxID=2712864 RepID=UPI0013ECC6AA|nr:hypothetical protein [Aquisphaera insulae]